MEYECPGCGGLVSYHEFCPNCATETEYDESARAGAEHTDPRLGPNPDTED